MPEYRVKWEIEREARTPKQAAQLTCEQYFGNVGTANVFDIESNAGKVVRVDLTEHTQTVIRRDGGTFDLTNEQIDTIREALRFAVAMQEAYFSFAPADYREAIRRDRKVLRQGGLSDETNSPAAFDYVSGGDKDLDTARRHIALNMLENEFDD